MAQTQNTRVFLPFPLGTISVVILFAYISLSLFSVEADEKKPDVKTDLLIQDLGSADFAAREAATNQLSNLESVIPALRRACKSADLEVRRRALSILPELEKKRTMRFAKQGLEQSHIFGKSGRLIEAADRVAYWGFWDCSGNGWDALTQAMDRVAKSVENFFPPYRFSNIPNFPIGSFRKYAETVHPKEIFARKIDIDVGDGRLLNVSDKEVVTRKFVTESGGRLLLAGEQISYKTEIAGLGIHGGIIASSGDVSISSARYSVVIAGGDVKNVAHLTHTIIVSDGDVELLRPPTENSLIVARGKVTCARGKILKCVIRSGHTLQLLDGKIIDLNDGIPDPLAFVKFFELADVGLCAEDYPTRAKSGTAGIRVTKVDNKSPFANNLHREDVITAIGNQKTPSVEVFRRTLRRKMAEGGPTITLSVHRGGKSLEFDIPYKD